MNDLIVHSSLLRRAIFDEVTKRKLSYNDIVEMAKKDSISIAKSNLSNYKNGKSVGTLSQVAVIYLALKLDINVNLKIKAAVTEADYQKVNNKLLSLLNVKHATSTDRKGQGNAEAEASE